MNVNPIKSFQFVHPNKPRILVTLGYAPDPYNGADCQSKANWRWSVRGTEIPFPVRSGSWFCGFDCTTMFRWFFDHGYELECETKYATGITKIYKREGDVPDYLINKAVQDMIRCHHKVSAMRLYQEAHSVDAQQALDIVDEIRSNMEKNGEL